MYTQHKDPPFEKPSFYIKLDALFLLFSVLYLIGAPHHLNNFFQYFKPIPIWLTIIQLWSLRKVNASIYVIFWGPSLGSLGIVLLIFGIFYGGALAFLIDHLLVGYAFVKLAREIAPDRSTSYGMLCREPLFIALLIILTAFSIWSATFIIIYHKKGGGTPITLFYDIVLVLQVLAGFYFYFTTASISSELNKAGLFFMIGSLVYFGSYNFLAQGQYNRIYPINPFWNSFLIMISYYVAQWLIVKGAFMTSVWLVEGKEGESPIPNNDEIESR